MYLYFMWLFSPSVDKLNMMSEEKLRHVDLTVSRDDRGFAKWSNLDLSCWAGIDLAKIIVINTTIKLKGVAKRGVVTCGLKVRMALSCLLSF